jgi:hypothetical protein
LVSFSGGYKRKTLIFITQCFIEYTSPWVVFELSTLVVICTDYTGSCQSKYHSYDHDNGIFKFMVYIIFTLSEYQSVYDLITEITSVYRHTTDLTWTHRVNLVTNLVISPEWGKDLVVLTTSGTYPWSFVTQIFNKGQPSHGGDRKTFQVMTTLLIDCVLIYWYCFFFH